jgi:hypothetical protein
MIRSELTKHATALLLIAFAAASRLMPHPPNFTPVAALALFGGVYLDRRSAFFIPLAAMLVSDWFIGFHGLMPYVYASLLATGMIGIWLKSRKSLAHTVAATVVSSVLFFVVTNLGVWLMPNSLYPKTMEGLVACYTAAIPFFRNSLLGDFAYVALLFGVYEFVARIVTRHETAIGG